MRTNSGMAKLSRKLVSMHRSSKTALMIAVDTLILPLCFLAAMWLRLGDASRMLEYGYLPYLYVPLVTIIVFVFSGLYRAVIRFIDRHLLTRTLLGLAVVVVMSYGLASTMTPANLRLPRNALLIYWLVAFAYVLASRLAVRSFLRSHAGLGRASKMTVAIYGAGEAGERLLQALRAENKLDPICFFDDKKDVIDHTIAGLRVFDTDNLVEIVAQMGIDQIVLAIPSASPKRRTEILRVIKQAGLPIKTMGDITHLKDGSTVSHSMRDIKIEDLLGRKPVPPMADLFARCINGKNVLVTGAGGSIGSELCRQILTQSPNCLHLLDHSEYALYAITQELGRQLPSLSLQAHLGSVCDPALVNRIVSDGDIHTIYHAAAYKHVPMVEVNLAEGIRNNVLGAKVVAAAAEMHHVQSCVLVSTDKAVRPTNVMGASKRIAELIFQAAASQAQNGTTFCMVRFGNVLGSSGSVVPLFQKQIEFGGPVTITHPDITRYFMLIPEAAQLVIQAGAMAKGGDVFVLDMGDPVKILELAQTMIELAGMTQRDARGEGDIEIQFIGLRPGEKLYEELLIVKNATPSAHPRIMTTSEQSLEPAQLDFLVEQLILACGNNDRNAIVLLLQQIVGEYTPQNSPEPAGALRSGIAGLMNAA